jgi:hypothetical protein
LNETKFQRIHTSHITRRALIGKWKNTTNRQK